VFFEYSILGASLLGVVISLFYCAVTGISPIPSSSPSRSCILENLPENLTGNVCELGAGWGTLAFPMAAALPELEVIAFELSPIPWLFMMIRDKLTRRKNLTIHRRNFFKNKFENVSLVVCYLHSECLEKLRPKMESELKPGTLVLSNTFEIPGWIPETIHRLEDSFCPQVYVYRVPSKIKLPANEGI
jgi:hypothetical protein